MTTKGVIVCGGRNFGKTLQEQLFIYRKLDDIFLAKGWIYGDASEWWWPDVDIISGEADGVDSVATQYALSNQLGYMGFPAEWEKYGKRAGPLRNKEMLEKGKPDLVVAFPGGKGTAHMVRIAREAGVEVVEIAYDH